MKQIFLLLTIAATTILSSCEGPQGPAGVPGQTGFSAESEVFEVNTSFSAANNFAQIYNLTPTILPSDNLLVYQLTNVQDGIDEWALLPQIYYFPQGQAQYNYTFSLDRFTLLIDGDFDLNQLPTSFTQGITFRIVIVPGYFSGKKNLDTRDYKAVIKALNLEGKEAKVLMNQ